MRRHRTLSGTSAQVEQSKNSNALRYDQFTHLWQLQWKTIASYLEAELDPLLHFAELNEESVSTNVEEKETILDQSSQCHEKKKVLQLDKTLHEGCLTTNDVLHVLNLTGECQRIRMILALHKLQRLFHMSDSERQEAQEQLRHFVLELPLATTGLIGIYGEKYTTKDTIQENRFYLSKFGRL